MNIKVSEIVGMFLDENQLGKSEYGRAYRIAIRGWRQLNWDMVGRVKTVVLSLDCDNTVALPDDFISELIIGVDNGDGGIAALSRGRNISPAECRISQPERSNIRGELNEPFGDFPTEVSLGVGSYENQGYFELDKAEHQLRIDPNYFCGDIILKYVAYTTVKGEYEINEMATEALLAWIDWKFNKADKRLSYAEKRDKRQAWVTEKANAKIRIKKLMISDMNKSARESVKMGVKI